MADKNGTGASKGLFASIEQAGRQIKEENNESILELKNSNSKKVRTIDGEELSEKRSYSLRKSTIRKLKELEAFIYPENITYNEIVDEAICLLYDNKKSN